MQPLWLANSSGIESNGLIIDLRFSIISLHNDFKAQLVQMVIR